MERPRRPIVIRTWKSGAARRPAARTRKATPLPHKPPPHNKT
jgi:hypothetical protein